MASTAITRTQHANRCVATHHRDPDRPRQAVDGLYVCVGHRTQLHRLITGMPGKADDLQPAGHGTAPRPHGSHSEINVDDRTADHRAHMAGVVASWCRVVAEDHNITPPASTDLHDTCPWLVPHLDWCAAHHWVADMLAELRQITGRAIGLTEVPAKRVPVGVQCLVHRDGRRCAGVVTLIVRADDWSARCDHPDCTGRQDDVTPYLRAVRRGCGVTEEDVSIMAARFGVPVSSDVLRQWRCRGKVRAATIGGAVWYDLASVTDYLATRKAQAERVA